MKGVNGLRILATDLRAEAPGLRLPLKKWAPQCELVEDGEDHCAVVNRDCYRRLAVCFPTKRMLKWPSARVCAHHAVNRHQG